MLLEYPKKSSHQLYIPQALKLYVLKEYNAHAARPVARYNQEKYETLSKHPLFLSARAAKEISVYIEGKTKPRKKRKKK